MRPRSRDERNTFLRNLGRIVVLWPCSLFILLLAASSTTSGVTADDLPPRTYLPLVGRDFGPAWQWYAPITPTLIPAPNHILLALDNTGQAHLFWDVSGFNQLRFIYHSYANAKAAGPWTSPTVVAASLGESDLLYPPMPGPDGTTLHLLWHNLAEPDHQHQLLYAAFRQGSWSPHEVAYQASGSLEGMVRADSVGQVAATIVDNSDIFVSKIVQVVRQGEAIWSVPQPITRSHPHVPGVVWPDFSGGVHLYEQESTSAPPLLYHSYWRNGAFIVREQAITARVFLRKTQLDTLGNLHIFWNDLAAVPGRNVPALYHQCLENSVQSLPIEIPSGELAISEYAGAADTGGRFALVWRDESGALRLGIWHGCVRKVIRSAPVPAGTGWQLRGLALNDRPDMACVLFAQSSYPMRYAVICGGMN